MASLDKNSVRKQVEKLKTDFEQLRCDGKVSVEVQAIMSSMLMMIEPEVSPVIPMMEEIS